MGRGPSTGCRGRSDLGLFGVVRRDGFFGALASEPCEIPSGARPVVGGWLHLAEASRGSRPSTVRIELPVDRRRRTRASDGPLQRCAFPVEHGNHATQGRPQAEPRKTTPGRPSPKRPPTLVRDAAIRSIRDFGILVPAVPTRGPVAGLVPRPRDYAGDFAGCAGNLDLVNLECRLPAAPRTDIRRVANAVQ